VRLDPYQRRLSMRTRVARALQALDIAGTRATACYAASRDPGLAPLVAELEARRGRASPRASPDFDLVDDAMDLVFRIEDRAAAACGEPEGADRALLLLARQRAGGPS
jgi:hypothetical protein